MGLISRLARFFGGRPVPVAVPDPAPLVPSTDAIMRWWISARDEQAHGVKEPHVRPQTRWDPATRDTVLHAAESGRMFELAQFIDAMRSDGLISGITGTLTNGLLRLPVKFSGDPFLAEQLRGRDPVYDAQGYCLDEGVEPLFWRMFPETELSAIMWDGILAGVGVGELVPQDDGGPPVLAARDLHWLYYRHASDTWHYQSQNGDYLVEPGKGRWLLFRPYGAHRPWIRGSWWPVALPFIAKQNAAFDRLRWQGQLADPLKVIEAADGADEKHRVGLLDFVRNLWRRAPGLVTPPKYKAGLVESNGRGYEVYKEAEERADIDIQVALAGQVVTTTGTTGFSSGSVWDNIRLDKVQAVAEALATTVHYQGLRPWAWRWHGVKGARTPWARWDVRSPEQRKSEAEALQAFAAAVEKADAVLEKRGDRINVRVLVEEQGLSMPVERVERPVAQSLRIGAERLRVEGDVEAAAAIEEAAAVAEAAEGALRRLLATGEAP